MLLRLAISIFIYDIWFYFSHKLLHTKYLYKYHKLHHSTNPTKLNYNDTYYASSFESIFQSFGGIFPIFIFNLGLYEFLLHLAFYNIRGMIRHDVRLIKYFGNHHIMHHYYPNKNFSSFYIDYVFGTNYKSDLKIN